MTVQDDITAAAALIKSALSSLGLAELTPLIGLGLDIEQAIASAISAKQPNLSVAVAAADIAADVAETDKFGKVP